MSWGVWLSTGLAIIAIIIALVPERSRFFLERTARLILRRPIISVWVRPEEEEIEYEYHGGRVTWHGIVIKNAMRLTSVNNCYATIQKCTSKLTSEEIELGRYNTVHWARCYVPHRHDEIEFGVSNTGRKKVAADWGSMLDLDEVILHYQNQHMSFSRPPDCFISLAPGQAEKLDVLAAIETQ